MRACSISLSSSSSSGFVFLLFLESSIANGASRRVSWVSCGVSLEVCGIFRIKALWLWRLRLKSLRWARWARLLRLLRPYPSCLGPTLWGLRTLLWLRSLRLLDLGKASRTSRTSRKGGRSRSRLLVFGGGDGSLFGNVKVCPSWTKHSVRTTLERPGSILSCYEACWNVSMCVDIARFW